MKFENISVYNIENALRGMRNPMSGWSVSDTTTRDGFVIVGPKDYDLASRLVKAGQPHRKFLRQIFVSVDICKMPAYLMHEFATYKIGTTLDCSSTMHKITSRPLTKDDFEEPETEVEKWHLGDTIETLNLIRDRYLSHRELGDNEDSEMEFRAMKRVLPHSYLYERMTWTANYETLSNIWYWRHAHRLPAWHEFCEKFIEHLPYSEFITKKFDE